MRLRLFASSLALVGLLAACGGTAGDDDEQATAGAATGGSAGTAKGGGSGQGAGAGGTTGSGGSSGTTGSGGSTVAGAGGATGVAGGTGGARAGNGGAAGSVAGAAGSGAGMSAVDGGMAGVSFGGGTSMGGRRGMGMGGLAEAGDGGLAFAGMSGMSSAGAGAGGGTGACTGSGHITYTLAKSASPTSEEQNAYDLITTAMDKAIQYYDCYTSITKAESVTYVPSVSTADGNSNGSIRFGSDTYYMEYITAMHEIAHTVGIGTASQWPGLVQNGIFTGAAATAQLRAITGVADDQVHADTQHFWPYGLNYQSEVKSEADVIDHCHMVVAIRADMGLQ